MCQGQRGGGTPLYSPCSILKPIPEQQKSAYPAQALVGQWVGLTQLTLDPGIFPLFVPLPE